jgi:hypothetical protein
VEGPGSIPGRGVNFALQGQQTTGLDSLDSKKAVWTAKSFLDSKKALWTAKKLVGQQNSSLDSKKLFVQQKSLLDSKKKPLGGSILTAGSLFGLEILFDSLYRPQPIAYFQGRSKKHWPLGGSNP